MYTLKINEKAYIKFDKKTKLIIITPNYKRASLYNTFGEASYDAIEINDIIKVPIVKVVPYYE